MRWLLAMALPLLLIWSLAAGWILFSIWSLEEYCVGEQCYAVGEWAAKINFTVLNALHLTWIFSPIVIILVLVPMLVVLAKQIKRKKAK